MPENRIDLTGNLDMIRIMLTRTLEHEVMDSFDEAMAYDAMDHQQVNQAFVHDLLAFSDGLEGVDEILDLGTGTARIPIELCRQHPSARVVAADLSHHMLDIARINLEISGLVERVLPIRVDAKSLELVDGRFHAVVSNSLIHHIPQPLTVLREALRVASDGGVLFFRDLLRPATEEEVNRLVATYAGTESEHAQAMFRASLQAALNLTEIRALIDQLGFPPETVWATSDRHWTWAARKPVAGPT